MPDLRKSPIQTWAHRVTAGPPIKGLVGDRGCPIDEVPEVIRGQTTDDFLHHQQNLVSDPVDNTQPMTIMEYSDVIMSGSIWTAAGF